MNNSILSIIKRYSNEAIICIGLGKNKIQNLKIANISQIFTKEHKCTILMIGDKDSDNLSDENYDTIIKIKNNDDINGIVKIVKKTISTINGQCGLIQIIVDNPAEILINLVFLGNEFAGVRGALSSAGFLQHLKENRRIKNIEEGTFHRIALMETSKKHQFFFAPVGIDEALTLENKQTFIKNIDKILNRLNIKPNISILSGGRIGDIGRDERVDKTIKDAKVLETNFQNQIVIRNEQILIESAIINKANFILAPDGVSGNLIYRTLVHLGGGKAFGALYSSLYLEDKKTIIDCSRIANKTEILGSLVLASGFLNLIQKKKKNELRGN